MTITANPNPTTIPSFVEAVRKLRDSIDSCRNSRHYGRVASYIQRHDANLPEGGKPLGWVLEALGYDDDSLVPNTRQIESAVSVFNGISNTLLLEDRLDAAVQSPYVGALHGRVAGIIRAMENPHTSAAFRRDLTWALPKAEQVLAVCEREIPMIQGVFAEIELWLDSGWDGFLDKGSFPQRTLMGFKALDEEKRMHFLCHPKKRADLVGAINTFFLVASRQGHDIIEEEMAVTWEAIFGRPVPKARAVHTTTPNKGGGKSKGGKAASKARARQRGIDERQRRLDNPENKRGYEQAGKFTGKK